MLRARTGVLTSLILAAGLVGCGSPISAEIEEYAGLLNESRALTCVCFADLGYSTMLSCDTAQGTISEDDQQCMIDALEGEEDAAKDYLDCASPLLEQYKQCMLADPGCEAGYADNCRAVRDSALSACPALSTDALPAFNLCHL